MNESAHQLRFRNIGGLIILDLIDMEQHMNREKVRRTLEELLHKDKAKTTLNRISDLGLIGMTRKRITLPVYTVVVNADPAVSDVLNALQDAESRFMREIVVPPRKECHPEQVDLVWK